MSLSDMSRVDRFITNLDQVISYYRLEYDLTYVEAVGALELIKSDLIQEARDA